LADEIGSLSGIDIDPEELAGIRFVTADEFVRAEPEGGGGARGVLVVVGEVDDELRVRALEGCLGSLTEEGGEAGAFETREKGAIDAGEGGHGGEHIDGAASFRDGIP
jgi:hypothetical protein